MTPRIAGVAHKPQRGSKNKGKEWREKVRYATLDLSSPYRKVFTTMVPDALQVADPFHLVKLANTKLDDGAGGCKTRPWDTGATSPIRCIGAGAS